MSDFIYKLSNNGVGDSSSGNQYGGNSSNGGSAIDNSNYTSNSSGSGLNEQQVRDIVNSVRNNMTEARVREIVNGMQKFLTGQNIMVDGIQKSQNFYTGVSGWQIDAEGNAEFNNGTFRGTFILGGTLETVSDITLLQTAIDTVSAAGGGTVSLVPKTYTSTGTVFTIPSNVLVDGNGSTIDFGGGAGQFLIQGTNAYTTGTITATFGSVNVVGVGTVWTAGMVGQSILLGDYWYIIASRTDNTHIALTTNFIGTNLSGDIYVIATTVDGPTISNITLYNSSTKLLEVRYVNTMTIESVICDTGTYGVYVQDSGSVSWLYSTVTNCSSGGFYGNNIPFSNLQVYFVSNITGTGIDITRNTNAAFNTGSIQAITGVGVKMTNCSNMDFAVFSIIECTSHGVEYVSGNTDMDIIDGYINTVGGVGIKFTSTNDRIEVVTVNILNTTSHGIEIAATGNDIVISSNTIKGSGGDGIKFTATTVRTSIIGCSITNSTGYGINIVDSTSRNNQIVSPAFSNNTSGNINDAGTNTTILPNVPFLTAMEGLTAGMPVGISNLSGGIARAKRTISSVAHGITTPLFDGVQPSKFAAIGGDKFVYLNYTAAGSDTLFAQVVSVDRTTLSIVPGTALTVATAFSPSGSNLANACVCKLGTDKFIVFYLADASATNIQYRVGTVSGTTITFGAAAATAITAASTVTTSSAFGADFLSTDKGVFFFKAATTTSSKVVVFTVSGTTATFSVTPVTPSTNSQVNQLSYVRTIGTDKFVLVTKVSSTSVYGQVFTCSGTVITSGTEAQISTTSHTPGNDVGICLISPATDVFIYGGGTIMVASTVATRTITAGTTVTAVTNVGLYPLSASVIYSLGTNSQGWYSWALSSTALTSNGIQANPYTTAAVQVVTPLDNGYFIETGAMNGATNIDSFIQGMSNNFIGFVASTVSRLGTAGVNITGSVNSAQTGLTPGAAYLVSNGALSFVAMNVTVDTLDDMDVGIAINSTQILT